MSVSKRRRYDAEFKRNAICLAEEPGRNARSVEQSLGIPDGMISKWSRQLAKNGALAFPGNGIEALTDDQKRIRELEKKLRDVEMDREILKSFFHTLKTRLIYHKKYRSTEELQKDLYWYIEIYYNRIRKHSANNWLTPDEKERKYYELEDVA